MLIHMDPQHLINISIYIYMYIYPSKYHDKYFKPFGPQADEGGESIAMDGFAAAESLYQQDPQVPKTALSYSYYRT